MFQILKNGIEIRNRFNGKEVYQSTFEECMIELTMWVDSLKFERIIEKTHSVLEIRDCDRGEVVYTYLTQFTPSDGEDTYIVYRKNRVHLHEDVEVAYFNDYYQALWALAKLENYADEHYYIFNYQEGLIEYDKCDEEVSVKSHTYYVFSNPNFAEICKMCENLEKIDYTQDTLDSISRYAELYEKTSDEKFLRLWAQYYRKKSQAHHIDIVSGLTGEVYATRYSSKLWEINVD